jgi:uncharacterized membrane protein YeaQ/YmgE (transglycosylase-associated protein family)
MDLIWTIIVTLVGGLILGILGKLVAPGDKDNIPLWLTVLCGIIGMIAGSFIYWGLFGSNNPGFDHHKATWDNATNGIDWIRHLWQIATAAVAVMAASAVTGRSKA